MPTLTQIRDAIHGKLSGVSGMGVVHKYERYAKEASALALLYYTGAAGSRRLHGWFIRRRAKRVTSPAEGRLAVVNEWMLRGYMSLDDADATELTFDALTEAIGAAFAADETLGGVVSATVIGDDNGADGVAGVQVEDSGPVLFAGVLCHSARLKVFTRHYE